MDSSALIDEASCYNGGNTGKIPRKIQCLYETSRPKGITCKSLVSHTIILFYLVLILCVGVSLLCVLINGRGLIMSIVSVNMNECTLCLGCL